MKIELKNLNSKELLKVLQKPEALFKKLDSDKKDVKETIELYLEKCNLSTQSFLALMALLKKYNSVQFLIFNTCTFFQNGGTFPDRDRRLDSVAMLATLGNSLAETFVKHFTLLDPDNMTSAEATIKFAHYIQSNNQLESITYYTGTRGTLALCASIQKMNNVTDFNNPNIDTPAKNQSQEKREQAKESYNALQIVLKQRKEKTQNLKRLAALSHSESSSGTNENIKDIIESDPSIPLLYSVKNSAKAKSSEGKATYKNTGTDSVKSKYLLHGA